MIASFAAFEGRWGRRIRMKWVRESQGHDKCSRLQWFPRNSHAIFDFYHEGSQLSGGLFNSRTFRDLKSVSGLSAPLIRHEVVASFQVSLIPVGHRHIVAGQSATRWLVLSARSAEFCEAFSFCLQSQNSKQHTSERFSSFSPSAFPLLSDYVKIEHTDTGEIIRRKVMTSHKQRRW